MNEIDAHVDDLAFSSAIHLLSAAAERTFLTREV